MGPQVSFIRLTRITNVELRSSGEHVVSLCGVKRLKEIIDARPPDSCLIIPPAGRFGQFWEAFVPADNVDLFVSIQYDTELL
jgi:hypothetical protein